MPPPLPEFLRNYGNLLNSHDGALFRTLVWLVGSVLLLVVVFTVGAVVQGVIRWWQRTAEKRKQDTPFVGHAPTTSR